MASNTADGIAPFLLYLVTSLAMSFVVGAFLLRIQLRLRRALDRSHRKQRQLSASARIDSLTGLINRAAFMRALDRALDAWRNGGPPVAVLLIDLDHFKTVKDTHGHAAGDDVLIETARRLSGFQEANTTVARLGGDEFALLLEDDQGGIPRRVGRRLLDTLAAPIPIPNGFARVGATIGLAVSEDRAVTSQELLHAADVALYDGKRHSRGSLRAYEAGMDEAQRDRSMLEGDLRRAMTAGEIVPYYQPLIELHGDRLIGFEVLARWQHPVRGIIPPTSFIQMAEESGRIGEMFYTLLGRACEDARNWPTDLRLSVNISPTQFAEPLMASRILSILDKAGFPPARLELEITESTLVDEVSSAREILNTLRNAGISVALDDFGTGYSSLRHLSDLPVDRLKIDRGFVASAQRNGEDWRIIRAIVQLAGTFNLATTAEGIEAPEILSTLRDMGCDIGQGYLFGRPISAEQTSLWLQQRPALRAMAS
ncbi:bifunctional diguanylate cyclase/phosphodiesterase [Kaistia sp. 32K]|uniref:putative bifunctional diguanylate cyclase/phosphodiesterase n=1 Tax=Kaistia sp. 32K TaxID=2795690 RepID=UPI001914DC1A|nr:EAL domain-containing protein [Kaistia sp. 32K]